MRRALLVVVLVVSGASSARADMIEPVASCPPGETSLPLVGCPGHGGGSTGCGPARCASEATCAPGDRCEDVARCFETVELECMGGDGRRPPEERPVSTFSQRHDRGPCAADGTCPGAATCERFRECHHVAAPPAPPPIPPSPAAGAPLPIAAPGGCGCRASRPLADPVLGVVVVGLAVIRSRRRRVR